VYANKTSAASERLSRDRLAISCAFPLHITINFGCWINLIILSAVAMDTGSDGAGVIASGSWQSDEVVCQCYPD